MTTATLSYQRAQRLQKKQETKAVSIDFPNVNWKMISLCAFLACFALLILYVWQINSLTRGAFLIGEYQSQVKNLANEKEGLETSFAQNSFLGQALSKIKALNFEETTSVKYIQIPDNSVAVGNYAK